MESIESTKGGKHKPESKRTGKDFNRFTRTLAVLIVFTVLSAAHTRVRKEYYTNHKQNTPHKLQDTREFLLMRNKPALDAQNARKLIENKCRRQIFHRKTVKQTHVCECVGDAFPCLVCSICLSITGQSVLINVSHCK